MSGHERGGIGLEYLSVFGMPLPEYVAMATRLECDFISVNYRGAANAPDGTAVEALNDNRQARQHLVSALADHGMRLELVEGFAITPATSVEDYAADLDSVAQLGARSICAVSLDKDIRRTNVQFSTLAEMAAMRGLRVTTEVGAGVMRNFEMASLTWRDVDSPNFTLLIDAMHFFRRGGNLQDLDSLPPGAIGHVQLCDVPMPARIESYMEEALFERLCPGDGDLPLRDFLARISNTVPIGLEVPIRSASNDMEELLRKCLSRTRPLIGPI
ncbi:sugar phosphate isomerase/epimerase [Novosphingobium sp. PhB165]|uniref:sugar phosphate isomerase/epimerase family protein n=1 Tax=Novosphingobium sp. PhB165 TaxID=2485105 RepID=UPI00104F8E55|nr:TIM barrel protein [Novosphingobium sp. PhB165]TCM11940.1 sugar phosphate isomerase/epimerase [Novosphingobium sp. PhB165]